MNEWMNEWNLFTRKASCGVPLNNSFVHTQYNICRVYLYSICYPGKITPAWKHYLKWFLKFSTGVYIIRTPSHFWSTYTYRLLPSLLYWPHRKYHFQRCFAFTVTVALTKMMWCKGNGLQSKDLITTLHYKAELYCSCFETRRIS